MPDLSKRAAELFMAELSAHTIIAAIDVTGVLSSNFSVRHKVRESNIKILLDGCTRTERKSYERVLSLAHLMCFSCAAYSKDNLESLYGCKGKALLETNVTPHYGGTAMLRNACVAEPMNLWLGATKENLQMNTQILDPHYVDTFRLHKDTYELPVPIVRSTLPTTDNDAYLARMIPDVKAVLQPVTSAPPVARVLGQTGGQRPVLTRTLTPTSAALQARIGQAGASFRSARWKETLGVLIGPEDVVDLVYNATAASLDGVNTELAQYRQSLVSGFGKAVELVDDTTRAGEEHYQHLEDQLRLRGVDATHSDVRVIASARAQWRANRRELGDFVRKHSVLLTAAAARISWDAHANTPILPANFFLSPR